MNVLLWILQVLLALHTVTGAVWKYSHSEKSIPSLRAMPHGVWLALVGVELLCALGLILPAVSKPAATLAPVAAAVIGAEMLLFSAVHLGSGVTNHGELVYWLVVAAFCTFIAWGRFVLKPL